MRSRTAEWFEIKVSYDKMQDDGMQKKITETYVVDALSYTEAESSIIEQISSYVIGEFKIKDIKQAAYHEIFFSEKTTDDYWFKAKVKYITIDEKTGKEKFSAVNYLFQAHNLQIAVKYVDECIGKGMADYLLSSIAETTIMDVFEHDATSKHLSKVADGNADDDIIEYESAES